MIENLKKLNQKQIALLVKREFVEKDLFANLPELKSIGSVTLIGSIGYGLYDDKSDIDVAIILNADNLKKMKDKLKEYKKGLKQRDQQIQLFYNTTFAQLEVLTDWQDDLKLREYADAIILHDNQKRFSGIQKRIKWYPAKVYKEKLNWLFAEAVFELEDRYKTAAGRKDNFYTQVSKFKLLQLLMTIVMFLNKSYPIYDKHLYRLQGKMKVKPADWLSLLNKAINTVESSKSEQNLTNLVDVIEKYLLNKRLIPKKDRKYWIDLRPTYQVKLK